jgi:hypothetical protein
MRRKMRRKRLCGARTRHGTACQCKAIETKRGAWRCRLHGGQQRRHCPGNSIGTLNINGSFTQNGGTYVVEANAQGQSDRINVGGIATLNGVAVQVLAAPGNYATRTTYTILNATGGVSGTYSGVSSNFAFLTPSLAYDANNVFLTLALQGSTPRASAATPPTSARSVPRSTSRTPVPPATSPSWSAHSPTSARRGPRRRWGRSAASPMPTSARSTSRATHFGAPDVTRMNDVIDARQPIGRLRAKTTMGVRNDADSHGPSRRFRSGRRPATRGWRGACYHIITAEKGDG